MEKRYPLWTKVVPLKKSIGCRLESCSQWKKAKNNQQPFLYVTGYGKADTGVPCMYLSWKNIEEDAGYNYHVDDVIPYQMNKEDAFSLLVHGKITESQYEEYTR